MHRRKLVRDALLKVLRDAGVSARRVHAYRSATVDVTPAIRIYTPQEDILPGQGMGPTADLASRQTVRIDAISKRADDVEDDVDALCEQIEAAISGAAQAAWDRNELLAGCASIELKSVSIDYEDDNQTVMVASMDYEALFEGRRSD